MLRETQHQLCTTMFASYIVGYHGTNSGLFRLPPLFHFKVRYLLHKIVLIFIHSSSCFYADGSVFCCCCCYCCCCCVRLLLPLFFSLSLFLYMFHASCMSLCVIIFVFNVQYLLLYFTKTV